MEEKMTKNDERRKHIRHDAAFSLKLGSDGIGPAVATEGLNISMGGIYCRVPHYIPLMTKLQTTLLLPVPSATKEGKKEEHVLDTEMIVVWSDPESEIPGAESYHIGCAFLPMAEEQRNRLRDYLDTI